MSEAAIVQKPPRKLTARPSPRNHPMWLQASAQARVRYARAGIIPSEADITGWFAGVEDQDRLGSCTAFGGAEWYEVRWGYLHGHQLWDRRSAQALYAWERMAMGTFPQDSGGDGATLFSIMAGKGVPATRLCPYTEDLSAVPSQAAEEDGLQNRVEVPCLVPMTHDGIMQSLASGRPVGFACPVHKSFMYDTDAKGNIPLPKSQGDDLLGYHWMNVLGADWYGVYGPNHWGTSWGEFGWWRMTWDFVASQWMEAWNAS